MGRSVGPSVAGEIDGGGSLARGWWLVVGGWWMVVGRRWFVVCGPWSVVGGRRLVLVGWRLVERVVVKKNSNKQIAVGVGWLVTPIGPILA